MASSSRLPMMNCYEILEISPDTSLKDINSAYKRLALRHHPDKTKGDDAAINFQKITEAVEILRNPTTRREHDKQLGRGYSPHSDEERLFASPDYKGWKPNGMYRGTFVREDRYMFSFGESVHMNPQSKESQEELARWERTREEEVERDNQEKIRRAAEESAAEKLAKKTNRRKTWHFVWNPTEPQEELPCFEKVCETNAKKKGLENIRIPVEKSAAEGSAKEANGQKTWQSVFNADAEYFDVPRQTYNGGAYNGLRPVWYGGAKPNKESHGVLEADLAGEAEVDPGAEAGGKHEHGPNPDAQPDTGGDVTSQAPFSPDFEADPDIVPDTEGDAEPGAQRVDVLKAGPDHRAESKINNLMTGIEYERRNTAVDAGVESYPSEKERQTRPEHHDGTDADVATVAEGYTSVYLESLQCIVGKDLPASKDLSKYTMSGAWLPSSNGTNVKADVTSGGDTEEESAGSIYYDFSDTPPSHSDHSGGEDHHDLSTEGISSMPSSDASPILVWYDFAEFDEANVYPHLAPFIPYFTSKLADKSGRYSKDDFHGELKGMIMETYCGWLETVRVTIPGAADSVNAIDPSDCHHLGYWKKDLGHEECEECDLWRPIYTLVCPGCGIKRCVRCKFNEAE
ncbi:hypothetical protein BDV10DRAFT_187727 [Aspergillus recurvatus]